MIAQIIDLTHPKVFEKYRMIYGFSWDNYYYGLLGLELRKIQKEFSSELRDKLINKNYVAFYSDLDENNSKLIILGNSKVFRAAIDELKHIDEIHHVLDKCLNNFENYDSISYNIKGRDFNFNSPFVMGILNVTPDSFSDGGKYFTPEKAAEHGIRMIDMGADIIDIGGESSRPGADAVSTEEELKRVIPVIQKILLERPSAIISVDTYKRAVALEALQNGAVIINDISGFRFDPKILEITKKFNASIIIMHMLGNPKTMQNNPQYENVVEEIYDFLFTQSQIAQDYELDNIFVDPGIGFGKTVEHNLEILRRLGDFKSLGFPVLIGLSRKSFIGKLLNLDVDNRDEATSMLEVLSIKNGARLIRTHNVQYGIQISKLFSNLL